jgi:hypothetical protein
LAEPSFNFASSASAGSPVIKYGGSVGEAVSAMEGFFWRSADEFLLWLGGQFTHRVVPFERRFMEAELKNLKEFSVRKKPCEKVRLQLALL